MKSKNGNWGECCPWAIEEKPFELIRELPIIENRHSVLRGNDPVQASGQAVRGQRVFCSNRGQRGGCGKTFSLMLAVVLPLHTLTALRV